MEALNNTNKPVIINFNGFKFETIEQNTFNTFNWEAFEELEPVYVENLCIDGDLVFIAIRENYILLDYRPIRIASVNRFIKQVNCISAF